jgi:O-acetyl-ADP-ribose deacetylase (regulator of RNase III)
MSKNQLQTTSASLVPQISVRAVLGDIAKIQSDALVTAINSGGMWYGGIDGVIQRAADNLFHNQARAKMPLRDGQTIVAKGGPGNRGQFKDVVFVVDDLQQPLRQIVFKALTAAEGAGYTVVTVPAIRMGVMLGVVEKSIKEAVIEIAMGIKTFLETGPTSVKEVVFVVYGDSAVRDAIEEGTRRLLPAGN